MNRAGYVVTKTSSGTETRAVVRGSILARDQKIAAAMALLEWATNPKFVICYAHSEPMVRFIYENFDAWAREYFEI